MVTPEAQDIWVKRGGAISPNKQVPLDTYPDPLRKQSAQLLTAAAFISMLLPLLVFFSLQQYFVRGILAGSVKG